MINIDNLRQAPPFLHLSNDQLQWLLRQGSEVILDSGEFLVTEGTLARNFYVLLKGELQVVHKSSEQEIGLASYKPISSFGELPILLKSSYTSDVRALLHCQLFELSKEAFYEALAAFPALKQAMLLALEEKMHLSQVVLPQREKLIGLATLAAGLAHELNNPIAASSRAIGHLQESFKQLQPMTGEVSHTILGDLQRKVMERNTAPNALDPLRQSDLEDKVIAWLEVYDMPNAWKLAPTLVDANLDPDWLNSIAARVGTHSLVNVLTWLESRLVISKLLDEVDTCTNRISKLVSTVNEYSYLGQEPLQEVDVHEGIEFTLTILGHKLRDNIEVIREYDPSLPPIRGYSSKLNQVWTNLIDNAIDALERGKIWIRTLRRSDYVFVEIADDGIGIPPDTKSRIFEPFFTTKGIGKGTGLGLSISYHIITEMHRGSIYVTSSPGKTCFQVCLPIDKVKL